MGAQPMTDELLGLALTRYAYFNEGTNLVRGDPIPDGDSLPEITGMAERSLCSGSTRGTRNHSSMGIVGNRTSGRKELQIDWRNLMQLEPSITIMTVEMVKDGLSLQREAKEKHMR
jgi:hypothetical protein